MTSVPHSGANSVTPGGSVDGHTPGPWIYYADLPSAEPNWHIVTTANKMRVLANVHIEPSNRMDEANARLIAAAPDLLEAGQALQFARKAQKLAPSAENLSRVRVASDAFDEAIAKATAGETRNAEPIHRRDGDEG